jgi:hypothetical protein
MVSTLIACYISYLNPKILITGKKFANRFLTKGMNQRNDIFTNHKKKKQPDRFIIYA